MSDPPEFVSILDADFVPTPQFLKRAMSLFRDPEIGVVQTPQHFVNPDPIQINLGATKFWPDEQRFFFDIVLPAKDAWSAAFCCGTSSIVRMQPLMEIGGFPTDSVTEDYLLSLRLKEKGFLTAYLNEPLTYGLAPEGLKEYITQRSRWCLGFMQIARGRSGPLSLRSPLAFIDRVSLTEVFLNWTAVPLSRAIGLIIPPLSLAFGLHPFHASLYDLATRFLPYWLWCGLVMSWLSSGKVMPILFDVSQIVVMPQILKAAVFGLARPEGQKFQVTAKGGDRNQGFVEWTVMRPFVILIVLSLAAVLWAFYVNGGSNEFTARVPRWLGPGTISLSSSCSALFASSGLATAPLNGSPRANWFRSRRPTAPSSCNLPMCPSPAHASLAFRRALQASPSRSSCQTFPFPRRSCVKKGALSRSLSTTP